MAKKPTQTSIPQGATISTYRPGVIEGLTDATLGAALRQVERFTGASERDAYRRAGDVTSRVEQLTGWQGAERSARKLVSGHGGWGDALNLGLTLLPAVGGKVAKGMLRAAGAEAAPAVTNRLYNASVFRPEHAVTDAALPRYGFRSLGNPGELEDIVQSGYMRARPGARTNSKYFSMTDNPMGLGDNVRADKPTIRVKSEHIPEGSPVRRQHVELWDKPSETWVNLGNRKK